MNNLTNHNIRNLRIAGAFIILGFIIGILSISPSVDSSNFISEAATEKHQVISAALYQFILAFIYLVIGLLFYPVFSLLNKDLAVSFLSLRIIAVVLMIIGTIYLLSILLLSQGFSHSTNHNYETLMIIGNMLKYSRDYLNHVFMVFALGASNILLYYMFYQYRLVPAWLSFSGFLATILSISASILLLYQVIDVITPEYIFLNMPTAITELVLGLYLLMKGFINLETINMATNKKVISNQI